MFKFKPYSEDELRAEKNAKLLPENIYECLIKSFKPGTSNNGNAKADIELIVTRGNGAIYIVRDSLVDVPTMAYKTKHFCECLGVPYAGEITAGKVEGRLIHAKIYTAKGTEKPTGGFYDDKNAVRDYMKEVYADSAPKPHEDIKF